MKKHFSNVLSMIENHSGSFFTDQSFLNYYFNTLGLVDYNSLRKFDNYLFITEETINTNLDNKILHFIQKTFIPNDRLNLMKNVYDELFRFEDRGVLIKKLKDIVNGKKGVEIGVFTGSFSKYILENWDGVLYMVDVWRPLGEEYEDMSNHLNYQNAYQLAMDNIKGYEDRGIMIRATSKDASNIFEDNSLDFIYIDANHAYDFVKEDIRIWFPKLKKGGIFSGHDYLDMVWENDPNFLPNGKDKYIYTNTFEGTSFYNGVFGVNPAVDEFCKENGYTVNTTKEWFGTWWIIK
jgi:predicted O-methyltransferase YrrM